MRVDVGGRVYGEMTFVEPVSGHARGLERVARWRIVDLEPHVRVQFKSIFRGTALWATPPYDIAANAKTAFDLDWFLHRYPLRMEDGVRRKLRAYARRFRDDVAELQRFEKPDWTPPAIGADLFKPGFMPRRFQFKEIEILRRRKALLVGNRGSLGKTYTAAGFLALERKALPAVVVVLPNIQDQWHERLESWTHLGVHSIERAKASYTPPAADVYLLRYTQLAGWSDWFAHAPPRSVTFDEIQELRHGGESDKGAAAIKLREYADYCLGLSGSPNYNYVGDEAHNIFDIVEPGVLGTKDQFQREFCYFDGAHWRLNDEKAFGTHIRETGVFIRHTRDDLTPDERKAIARSGTKFEVHAPPPIEVPYDADSVRDLEQLARDLAMRLGQGSLVERRQTASEFDKTARMATGIGKAKGVAAFVRMVMNGGTPRLILWGWHREVYEIWKRELRDFDLFGYTGTETVKQKRASLEGFRESRKGILYMSLRAGLGKDGIQRYCSDGIFGEFDWSYEVMRQCVWRIARELQTEDVNIYHCYTNNGADPGMMETIGMKRAENYGAYEWAEDGDPVAPSKEAAERAANRIRAMAKRYLSSSGVSDEMMRGLLEGLSANAESVNSPFG
ncbi:MAG: DEAD/DEAH box helicase [Alphaproteobacteria bacterium]|nr:DEAD/DEAH box helicase [Alphaproteobacteria bacterium]